MRLSLSTVSFDEGYGVVPRNREETLVMLGQDEFFMVITDAGSAA